MGGRDHGWDCARSSPWTDYGGLAFPGTAVRTPSVRRITLPARSCDARSGAHPPCRCRAARSSCGAERRRAGHLGGAAHGEGRARVEAPGRVGEHRDLPLQRVALGLLDEARGDGLALGDDLRHRGADGRDVLGRRLRARRRGRRRRPPPPSTVTVTVSTSVTVTGFAATTALVGGPPSPPPPQPAATRTSRHADAAPARGRPARRPRDLTGAAPAPPPARRGSGCAPSARRRSAGCGPAPPGSPSAPSCGTGAAVSPDPRRKSAAAFAATKLYARVGSGTSGRVPAAACHGTTVRYACQAGVGASAERARRLLDAADVHPERARGDVERDQLQHVVRGQPGARDLDAALRLEVLDVAHDRVALRRHRVGQRLDLAHQVGEVVVAGRRRGLRELRGRHDVGRRDDREEHVREALDALRRSPRRGWRWRSSGPRCRS